MHNYQLVSGCTGRTYEGPELHRLITIEAIDHALIDATACLIIADSVKPPAPGCDTTMEIISEFWLPGGLMGIDTPVVTALVAQISLDEPAWSTAKLSDLVGENV